MVSRRLRTGACGLLALLVAGACGPGENLESASDLAGDYARSHRVWIFHGNEPVEVEVADRLLLTAANGTSLRFDLELFDVNGQECRLEGLARRRSGFFAYIAPGASDSCELRFQPEEGLIVVTDMESRCSSAHCGGPGAIGRVSFSPVE